MILNIISQRIHNQLIIYKATIAALSDTSLTPDITDSSCHVDVAHVSPGPTQIASHSMPMFYLPCANSRRCPMFHFSAPGGNPSPNRPQPQSQPNSSSPKCLAILHATWQTPLGSHTCFVNSRCLSYGSKSSYGPTTNGEWRFRRTLLSLLNVLCPTFGLCPCVFITSQTT